MAQGTVAYRKKHLNRPRKKPADKRRREKVQKTRLIKLGVPAAEAAKLSPMTVRTLLKRPAKLKKQLAAK